MQHVAGEQRHPVSKLNGVHKARRKHSKMGGDCQTIYLVYAYRTKHNSSTLDAALGAKRQSFHQTVHTQCKQNSIGSDMQVCIVFRFVGRLHIAMKHLKPATNTTHKSPPNKSEGSKLPEEHARTYARTYARMHTRTHARTLSRSHIHV